MIRHTLASTELGWVGLALGEHGVRAVSLPAPDRSEALARLAALVPQPGEPVPPAEAAALQDRLRRLIAGASGELGLPLDPVGTPFQRAVWEVVASIPRGQTRSYGWIAARLGMPGAARAVGRAVGANPLPLLVPCHRVVAAGGRVGGFAGGVAMKRALLSSEGVTLRPALPVVEAPDRHDR